MMADDCGVTSMMAGGSDVVTIPLEALAWWPSCEDSLGWHPSCGGSLEQPPLEWALGQQDWT